MITRTYWPIGYSGCVATTTARTGVLAPEFRSMLGPCWLYVGLMLRHVGPSWAYVGPCWAQVWQLSRFYDVFKNVEKDTILEQKYSTALSFKLLRLLPVNACTQKMLRHLRCGRMSPKPQNHAHPVIDRGHHIIIAYQLWGIRRGEGGRFWDAAGILPRVQTAHFTYFTIAVVAIHHG